MSKQYTPEQRQIAFWAKVNKNGPIPEHRPELANCWIWQGATTNNGYGRFQGNEGKLVLSHRFAFGLVPEGLQTDHLCRIHACVRRSHLEAVTGLENARRGINAEVQRAKMKSRTHCPQGHPYDEANTTVNPNNGNRQCRACGRVRQRVKYREVHQLSPSDYRLWRVLP